MRRIILTALLLALAGPLSAAPAPEPIGSSKPTSPAPELKVASAVDLDMLTVVFSRTTLAPVTVMKERPNPGVPAKLIEMVVEQVPTTISYTISVNRATVTTVAGDKIELKDALKRLKGGEAALFSAEPGKPVDPAWLKLFRSDVLVFVQQP